MTPEERKVLQETYELSKENNEMLHSLRRSMRWGRIIRALYWAFIIAGAIGVTVWVGPILQQLLGTYQEAINSINGVKQSAQSGIESSQGMMQQLQDLLKDIKAQ